jgi:hypothetical protein
MYTSQEDPADTTTQAGVTPHDMYTSQEDPADTTTQAGFTPRDKFKASDALHMGSYPTGDLPERDTYQVNTQHKFITTNNIPRCVFI